MLNKPKIIMEPNIVWRLETDQLNRAITKFKGKYSDISEDDWSLICYYYSLIMSNTKHIHPYIEQVLDILKSEPIPVNWLDNCTAVLDDAFRKYVELYKRNTPSQIRLFNSLQSDLLHNQWPKVIANRVFDGFDQSLQYLLWISLFKDLPAVGWQLQVIINYEKLLAQCIDEVFATNEETNRRCKHLINQGKHDEVIKELKEIKPYFSVLKTMLDVYPDLKIHNITHPSLALRQILEKQLSLSTQQDNQNRLNTTFTDVKRDTSIGTTIIENYVDRLPIAQNQSLQKISSVYSDDWKITPTLKNFLMFYANQHGITQSFNKLFTSKMNQDTIAFTTAEKTVYIEHIAPNKIRIITPVIYYAYMLPGNPPITSDDPVKYEFSSIVVEDTAPSSEQQTFSNIKIKYENNFYELPNKEISKQMIKVIIDKIIKNIQLDTYDNTLIEQYCRPFSVNSKLLKEAPNEVLFLLSYNNYQSANIIFNDKELNEKFITSEYNTTIPLIYQQHQKNEYIKKSLANDKYFSKIANTKPLLDTYIVTQRDLLNEAGNTVRKQNLSRTSASIVNQIMGPQHINNIFDVFRTYNNQDKKTLLLCPEIARNLSVDQLMVLQKTSLNIAFTLLEPPRKVSTFTDIWKNISNYANHPSQKLSQDDYFQMLETHPGLWQVEGGGFGRKEGFASSWFARTFAIARWPFGFSHRSALTAETLVRCITSDNERARKAAINAIANDEALSSKVINSSYLLNDKSKMVRFYLEAPDNLKKEIKNNTNLFEKIIEMNNEQVNRHLEISYVETFNTTELIDNFVKSFNKNPDNVNSAVGAFITAISKQLNSPHLKDKIINLIIQALNNTDNKALQDTIIQHFSEVLIEKKEHIALIRNNKIVFDKIVQATMRNIVEKFNKGTLNISDYNYLAQLYSIDPTFSTAIDAHHTLLHEIIQKANIVHLTEMLKSDPSLIHDYLTILTTHKETRQRMIGDVARVNNVDEIREFISTLLKKIHDIKGPADYHYFTALLKISQLNPQIEISDIILNDPDLNSYGPSIISDILKDAMNSAHHILESTVTLPNAEVSKAMLFLALPADEREKYINNNKIMQQIFEHASPYELNMIFSEHHPTLVNRWSKLIQESDKYSSNKIRDIIISRASILHLTDLLLYGGEVNRKFIMSNNRLIQKILSDPERMIDVFIHNEDLRNEIEKNELLSNRMLTANIDIRQQWVDVYLKASYITREKIINNNKLLDLILLSTNPLILPQALQAEPTLSTHIVSRLYAHYFNSEFMKTMVNLHPTLMKQMINYLQIEQLITLLNKHNTLTDNPVITAILDNKECCKKIIFDEHFRLRYIPNHRLIMREILIKHSDLLTSLNLTNLSDEQKLLIDELKEIDTPELQQNNVQLSVALGIFKTRLASTTEVDAKIHKPVQIIPTAPNAKFQ